MAKKINNVPQIVEKLDLAYKIGYANKIFSAHCNNVCMGRKHGACEKCPVEAAYKKAVEEIAAGKREAITPTVACNYGATRKYDGKGHKTLIWRG